MATRIAEVKKLTMGITINADTGEVLQVGRVEPAEKPIKGISIKKLKLEGLTQNPSVVLTSHNSPGCITYIVNGQYYRICW